MLTIIVIFDQHCEHFFPRDAKKCYFILFNAFFFALRNLCQ